ncbi:hypothetical protein [Flavobacterium sp.]|uniref:hypothetical protein n=1 Tax=Flavobacterium sp. TaxID=239 RepID=UPI00120DEFB3|nr:hypothetical protein [Flavobacterium sp.]RZJ72190.1 MAG: hypothetical protein EOO49_06985 [Flavobacterium sp.]
MNRYSNYRVKLAQNAIVRLDDIICNMESEDTIFTHQCSLFVLDDQLVIDCLSNAISLFDTDETFPFLILSGLPFPKIDERIIGCKILIRSFEVTSGSIRFQAKIHQENFMQKLASEVKLEIVLTGRNITQNASEIKFALNFSV